MNINIRLDESTRRQLADHARQTQRPQSAIVREAVLVLLSQAPARPQGRQRGWSPAMVRHMADAVNGRLKADDLPPFESCRT